MAFPIVNGMRAIEFGSKGENRAHLNSLVLDANKRATAGHFKYDYEAEGEPLEFVGEKLAMLDNDGNAVATLLITRAELVRFADVSDEFAIAEGEGDLKHARQGEINPTHRHRLLLRFRRRCP